MQIPQGIDIAQLQRALARRAQGGSPAGGGGMPMIGQTSMPVGSTPTGGQPTPRPTVAPNQPTTPPPAPRVNIGSRQPAAAGGSAPAGAARAAMVAQGPNFDDDTKKIAKALVSKLIGYL